MNELARRLQQIYKNTFQQDPLLVCSPGRVNLIGEHTDYNEGFVLPAAVDKAIYLAVGLRQDDQLHFYADDLQETFEGTLQTIQPTATWADYLLGVIQQIQSAGFSLPGINCIFGGTIPMGAGMSSSAALENGIGFALDELAGLGLDRIRLAQLSQRAENEFVGAQVGIMDMFASMMGRADHVIQLDCRSLDYAYAPFRLEGIDIVLCDSRVKHSLVTSDYNTRRAECEAGVHHLRAYYPSIHSLRDVTLPMLDACLLKIDPLLYKRCSYVVEENSRVQQGVDFLKEGKIAEFGQLLYQSHEGLKTKYEVSCPELDLLVELAARQAGVLGARLMGGGFGGCTINLVQETHTPDFIKNMTIAYQNQTNRLPILHSCTIQQGTAVIDAP